MATSQKKVNFLESEDYSEIKSRLEEMVNDTAFNTQSSYSSNNELHPDNRISFVDKHIKYLCTHPSTDPRQYLANLRLMTRLK